MLDAKVKEAVERGWLSRAKAQYLKPGTDKYRAAEIEFFAGAMATLQALFPNEDPSRLSSAVPTGWVISAMSGRPIVDNPQGAKS